MDDATILYIFRHASGRKDHQISVGPDTRSTLASWLHNWRKAEPETIAGVGLARTGRWEGPDMPASVAIQVQWEGELFLISPDVVKSWAANLDAAEPGVYVVLPEQEF